MNTDNKNTGLEASVEPVNDEKSLLASLLEAADYKNDDKLRRKVNISRGGKRLFSFTVRPVSEQEAADIRQLATEYMPNPQGPKYPKIAKRINNVRYNNALIYTATIDEDRAKIWGNKQLKERLNVIEDADVVDKLLTTGEKNTIIDLILELSGGSGDGVKTEEMIKN